MSLPPVTAPEATETLVGLVERVTFQSSDSGFCVLRVRVRGRREPAVVVGRIASVAEGETLEARGRWVNDARHGLQFRADEMTTRPPSTLEGIEKFLGSGMVRGVGRHFAGELVRAFGERVFDVIERTPARLREIKGVGPKRAEAIAGAWGEQKAVRDVMVFLHSHGVGTARAVRIVKRYGRDAVRLVREDPYRLARDIQGIGFPTADAIAGRLGIAPDAPVRARAGVAHVVAEATGRGHCGIPREALLERAQALLSVDRARVEEALAAELEEGSLVADDLAGEPCVWAARLHRAECEIAARLRALREGAPPWPAIDASRALPWVQAKLGLELAPSQREAVELALGTKVLVVTGGPGVGKTTLVNAILAILRAKRVRVALCAPTGRAAKRLGESTGLDAKTVHRLLEVDPRSGGFKRGEARPLEADLVVVDETSMLDVPLTHALLRAVPPRAALLLVGDVDQLPSVGPGRVLADTIESRAVATVRLREIFRQAAASRIVVNAHRVNEGELPDLGSEGERSDFYFVDARDAEDGQRKIVSLVRDRIPGAFGLDPLRDVQVLSPMNRGGLGARSLNPVLQQALHPGRRPAVERFGTAFAAGDRVMQVENDYDKDVYNGDLGVIRRLDEDAAELIVDFDGRGVVYGYGELDQLALAYAITIHKSQGSEYPAVVIPLVTQHFPMLRRKLLYTAITRGKRLVVIVGQRKALALAVREHEGDRRVTKLGERLAQA